MLPLKRILHPTDFSEASYEALEAAQAMALHFSAELYLVNVIPFPALAMTEAPMGLGISTLPEQMVEAHRRMVQALVKEKISEAVRVQPLVVGGGAALQIIRIAEENEVDLIVMATHGQTGWRHLIFGSVAEKVVQMARCPVLVIHALQGTHGERGSSWETEGRPHSPFQGYSMS
jgi:nucleotide-binding universal stress UspA family protein